MELERCPQCGNLVTCGICGFVRATCAEVGQQVAGPHVYVLTGEVSRRYHIAGRGPTEIKRSRKRKGA